MSALRDLPVGIRNNNPGNLKGPPIWNGSHHGEGNAIMFETLVLGVRALAIDLTTKYKRDGLRTVDAIISKYAPPSENDTRAYVMCICQDMNINPLQSRTADVRLDCAWRLFDFIRAIVRHENGPCPLSWKSYPEWVAIADLVIAISTMPPDAYK